jgi:hypothetical protein
MQFIELKSKDGIRYTVPIPKGSEKIKRGFVFAYAKSGSTLLDRLVREYCKIVGIPTLSLFGEAFSQGVKPQSIMKDALRCFDEDGIVHTGFRHFPVNFELDFRGSKQLLLVRDPRDMLVSLYYSIAKSHVKMKGDDKFEETRDSIAIMSIDDFVIERAPSYMASFRRYEECLPEENLMLCRYEDVIFKKFDWLISICDFFDLPINEDTIGQVASKHDSLPNKEDDSAHIRQVHPGNYKSKLQPLTIQKLNECLKDFLNKYQYEY